MQVDMYCTYVSMSCRSTQTMTTEKNRVAFLIRYLLPSLTHYFVLCPISEPECLQQMRVVESGQGLGCHDRSCKCVHTALYSPVLHKVIITFFCGYAKNLLGNSPSLFQLQPHYDKVQKKTVTSKLSVICNSCAAVH